jgi:fibro-slime domain-containing protein
MKKLRNNKIRKLLAFMVALALMVSCMPSAYTISASEAFGDGTEDIFTDGEITSEPAAEESTPDVSSADQEETEQAQQSTLTYENDSVKVTAEALEDGALPQNTALKADGVNENSSVSYDTVSQKLSAAATDKGSSLRGFFAYDVYFADGDGNRVEPNGRVRVTFEYKTPAAPELTDAASTSVTVEKLHYNSSTGDTDVNTLQANEDLKVLNVNEGKQIQTLQVETGNAAVFAVMWDSPETADVKAEAVSGNEDEASIASEELTDGMDISDEPEQDAAETPAAENPEVTPDAEPSEAPAENPDAEPTEAPAENPDVVEEPAEDIESPEDVPAADENGETSLIEVLGDDTNLRVSPSIEAEVLATVNAGTQLTLLDTVTAEDGATWYKVSWEGTEAYIRSDMAQVVDSSDEAEEPEDVQEEEIQPEITRYDYKSDEVNVKVTLTDPADLPDNAELSVTPVELSQEAEDQITEEAIKEKKAIEKIHAYDIKFLVDGEEVQPGATVKVSVSLNDEKKIKDADVYHVDENDNVENMDGSVAKNGDVEFETTHFSTYVIVNKKNDGTINVTVEHYDNATHNKIYADDKWENLTVGQQVNCKKAVNWDIDHVEVITNSGETAPTPDSSGKIYLAQNATVKVYYNPSTGTTVGQPTFYDYTVKAVADKQTWQYGYPSINQNDSYSSNASSQRITMGAYTHQYGNKYQYTWSKDGHLVNDWTESDAVIKGLLKGIDQNNSVVFNYPEPGLFVNSDKNDNETGKSLRKVYTDFNLGFERSGDTYTLKEVNNNSGKDVAKEHGYDYETGNNFFPLDEVTYEEYSKKYKSDSNINNETYNGPHNYYFGMRYEIRFQLKDYIGDLNYSFKGDDDMWVVLDGGKTKKDGTVDYGNVIIDLGGIHNAASANVDLWEKLFGKAYANGTSDKDAKRASLTPDQKEEWHTLTVLYLERGAGLSNCKMNFTLPNAEVSSVTTTDLAKLTFTKVKKDGNTPLPGAVFKLYTDDTCTTELKMATSGADGTVTFDKLFPGTYYMKEVQAPNGYVASNEVWTVDVTEGNETATLKDSSNNTVTSIVNETPEEIINSIMTTSKTAKVKDWDQRTYDITINATSTSTSPIIETKTSKADIMLVLDVSGSMEYPLYKYNYERDNTSDGRRYLVPGKTYYICVDGSYKKMEYKKRVWKVQDNGEWYLATDFKYSNCKIYTRSSTETRLAALKNAVNQFIDDTAEKSPNSKIGITVFSSTNNEDNEPYGDHGKSVNLGTVGSKVGTADSAKVTELKTFVEKLNAEGGTDPAVGLKDAKDKLDATNDDNPKYVVLFTDGKPTGGTAYWNSTAQKNAETQASELRTGLRNKTKVKDPYTVYTIGFALDDEGERAKTFLSGGPYKDKNYKDGKYPGIASSKDCAKTADDAASLTQIFQSISSTIHKNVDITGATITDVIDRNFEIVDKGKVITEDDFPSGKYVLDKGGIVTKRNDGTYQVQWTDQTIKHTTDGTNGWSRTITVKAKDSFIGGNNIPTNVSPDSKISVGDLEKVLNQPTVNVKVNLVVKDKEITIYKGDTTVPTVTAIQNAMFDTSGATSYVNGTISANDARGRITYKWYKKDANESKVEIAENEVTNVIRTAPADTTEYYLEVIYSPATESNADSKTNTTTSDGIAHSVGNEKAHNKNNKKNLYGTYKINVISGQIQIIKNVKETSTKDRTFTFNVEDSAGNPVSGSPLNVKVEADKTSGTATLENLPRGTYTVTEAEAEGYTIQAFDVVTTGDEQTDCQSSSDNNNRAITFTLGNNKKAINVITNDYTYKSDDGGGVKGVASCTNEMVTNLDLKKTDNNGTNLNGAKFELKKKDSQGNWSTVQDGYNNFEVLNSGENSVELKKLTSGNYKLKEITAPTGYMVLSSEIYFKVAQGNVTLTDAQGKDLTENSAHPMWSLATDSKTPVLTIENQKVYSLPNSGGPGTYGFTISGVAILATALLLFINNKRREEEAKRS